MSATKGLHPDMVKGQAQRAALDPRPNAVNIILRHFLLVVLVSFLVLRFPDCIAALQNVPLFAFMFVLILGTLAATIVKPPASLPKMIKRFAILAVVIMQVKNQLDGEVTSRIADEKLDFTGETVVIADGHGKLAQALAEKLLRLHATIIVGCPSDDSTCFNETEHIVSVVQADAESRQRELWANQTRTSDADARQCGTESEEEGRCAVVKIKGGLTVAPLDIADFSSIKAFSDTVHELTETNKRVDYLICNGGRSYFEPDALSAQGWERSLGAMYLGQHYLTKLLYDRLLTSLPLTAAATQTMQGTKSVEDDPAALMTGGEAESLEERLQHQSIAEFYKSPHVFASRVIYVGSFAYFAGNFDPSLLQGPSGAKFAVKSSDLPEGEVYGDLRGEVTRNCGKTLGGIVPCCPLFPCPLTNGFARGALAQLLEVTELQARVDRKAAATSELVGSGKLHRRLVTAVVNPGFVDMGSKTFSTSLTYNAMRSLFDLMLRRPDDSVRTVLYAMTSHSFVPGSYIDSMLVGHDFFGYIHSVRHSQALAYPAVRQLGFMKDKTLMQTADASATESQKEELAIGSGRGVKGSGQMLRSDENSWEDWLFRLRFGGVGQYMSNGVDVGQRGVAQRLWEASEATVRDWEANHVK